MKAVGIAGLSLGAVAQAVQQIIAPSTLNLSYTQAAANLLGSRDTTTSTGTRTSIMSSWRTCWVGRITGTAARMRVVYTTSAAIAVMVSINGGADTLASYNATGNTYTLFSGLPQGTYDVVVRISDGFGNFGYFTKSWTDMIQVDGAPPSVESFSEYLDPLATTSAYVTTTAGSLSGDGSHIGGNFISPQNPIMASSNTSPSWRFRTAASLMVVYTRARYVYYTVDNGSTYTRVDTGIAPGIVRPARIPLDGSDHTYNVWVPAFSNTWGQPAGIYLNAPALTLANQRRMYQFGTSLTAAEIGVGSGAFAGRSCTGPGESDIYRVASALGYCGQNMGKAGRKIFDSTNADDLRDVIDNMLLRIQVGADDVAIVEMGRNDSASNPGTAMTTDQANAYAYVIDALLTKGFRRVLCHGQTPEGTGGTVQWTNWNASVQAMVTARADARVKYIDPTMWNTLTWYDGVHYDDIGYNTLVGYRVPAYGAAIA